VVENGDDSESITALALGVDIDDDCGEGDWRERVGRGRFCTKCAVIWVVRDNMGDDDRSSRVAGSSLRECWSMKSLMVEWRGKISHEVYSFLGFYTVISTSLLTRRLN